GDLELRMAGAVAVLHPVAVGEALGALRVHEHRTEGLVPGVDRLSGEVHAAAQVSAVIGSQGRARLHAPTTAHPRAPRRPGAENELSASQPTGGWAPLAPARPAARTPSAQGAPLGSGGGVGL